MALSDDWETQTQEQLIAAYRGPLKNDLYLLGKAFVETFNTFGGGTGAITRVTNPGDTEIYKPTAETSVARATAVRTALAASSTGQTVVVPAGTYDMTNHVVTIPEGVTLWLLPGAIIVSDVDGADDGAMVNPVGDGCTIVMWGATIKTKDSVSSGFQFPVGTTENAGLGPQPSFTNLRIFGGILQGQSDAFYIQHSEACSAKLYGVTLKSTFDACVAFNDAAGTVALHVVECFDCAVEVVGPFAGTGPDADGLLAEDSATIRYYGGSIDVRFGGTGNNNAAIVEHSGVIELHNVRTFVFNSANPKFDLKNNGGTIRVTGGAGSGLNGIWLSSGEISPFSAADTNTMFAFNGTTGARTLDLTLADVHALGFDYSRSGFFGGRINGGLNLGSAFGTYRSALHVPQYGATWGWNHCNKGVTVSSPGDTTKGTMIFGYNNLNGGQYNTVTGQANAAISSGGTVGGRENLVGYTSESTARVFLVSHNNSTQQVVVAGDLRTQFPVNAYVAFWQTDGTTPALSLQVVTAVSYSAPNTTITFDRKGPQDYNGNTSSWVMNITTAVVNSATAFGYRNIVHGMNAFVGGESNSVFQTAPNATVFGKSNTITGSADGAILLGESNTVSTGKYSFLVGNANTNTTFNYGCAIGQSLTIGGTHSHARGYQAVTRFYGHDVQASGRLVADGDAQTERWTLRGSISHINANWFPLSLDGAGFAPTLPNNSVMVMRVLVVGKSNVGTKRFGFSGEVVIHRTGGTYNILAGGTLGVLYNTDDTSFTARVTNTSSTISVEVSDSDGAGDTVRWVASVWAVQVTN